MKSYTQESEYFDRLLERVLDFKKQKYAYE